MAEKAITLPRRNRARKRLSESEFMRRYGILCTALIFLFAWSALVWITAYREASIKVTEELTAEYDHEYELKEAAFIEAWTAEHTPSEDEELEAQIRKEADLIARAIGPMKTQTMKLTMLWNILARVDSPYYPDTVEEVIAQPKQWMFYDENNPIREDDVELAMDQLRNWHEGRYPARFDSSLVYGQWSQNDYVLFDNWSQGMGTKTWRYGE